MIIRNFFKNTFVYGLATVLPRVINFLLVKVHTSALKTSDYAINTDFYIWIALIAVVLTFGMETSFFRFYNSERQKNKVISTGFITTIGTVFLFGATLYIFQQDLLKVFDFSDTPTRANLLFGILAFDTLSIIPFAYLRITNQAKKYAIIKFINVSIIVLINLIFLKYIPEYLETDREVPILIKENFKRIHLVDYIFIANLIGSGISFLLLIRQLVKFKLIFDFTLFFKMIRYSWPVVIAGIAYIINENLDKFLIKRLIGNSEMGVYSACYKLSIFMNLYITAFRLGAEPMFFNLFGEKNDREIYAKIMSYFVILGTLIYLFIVSFIGIFKNFIDSAYWEALFIVPILLLANLFLGIYHNLSIWYKLTDKTYFGMYFSIIGAILTIVLNLTLIPKMGYIASALITLIVYVIMSFMSYLYGRKRFEIPYDTFKIVIYLFLSTVLSMISFYYFESNYWVSSSIVLFFLILIFLNEKQEIKSLLNKTN
jgi:O-antigen/teichoic acid export membrane protein